MVSLCCCVDICGIGFMKLPEYARKPLFIGASFVFLALALRLAVMLVTSGAAYDFTSYHLQAQSVFEQRNVYLFTDRYPYPPVWIWLVSLAQWAATMTGLPFAWFVKAPGIVGDCFIVALLWRRVGERAALFYACNPVSLLITAGHGQFDGLVMSLAVAAWMIATGKQRRSYYWAALALGGAIALKGYPLLFLPPLVVSANSLRQRLRVLHTMGAGPAPAGETPALRPHPLRQQRLLLGVLSITGLAALPLVVALVVYGGLFGWAPAMFSHVLGYSSYPYFGWALYVDVLLRQFLSMASFIAINALLSLAARTALLIVVGWLIWRGRRWPLERLWLALTLAVYALAPGIAVQYFLWALPLLAIVDRKRGMIYTLLSFLAMVLFYLTQEPGALPWGTALARAVPQSLWLSGYVVMNLPWWLMCLWLLRTVIRDAEQPTIVHADEQMLVAANSLTKLQ